MPLKGTESRGQVHSQPDGISFWMTDGQKAVRVFVTYAALHHELDHYAGPLDQFHGLAILREHRERIERTASAKFDTKGVRNRLDGQPALWIRTMDL